MRSPFLRLSVAAIAILGVVSASLSLRAGDRAAADQVAFTSAGGPVQSPYMNDGNNFHPPGLRVDVGGSVVITLKSPDETHTVTFPEGVWFGTKPFDETLDRSNREAVVGPFDRPGAYYFYCKLHGNPDVGDGNFNPYTSMVAKIVVGGVDGPVAPFTPTPTRTPSPTLVPATATPTASATLPPATPTATIPGPPPTATPGARNFVPGASAAR